MIRAIRVESFTTNLTNLTNQYLLPNIRVIRAIRVESFTTNLTNQFMIIRGLKFMDNSW